MVIPFRTFAVFSLAFGMLAAGYLLGPAPGGAMQPSPSPASKAAAAAAEAKALPPALVTIRPPVPLVRPQPTSYFTTTAQDSGAQNSGAPNSGAPSDKPAADTAALTTDQVSAEDADAKRAIEFDGYRNVHAVVKGSDGTWHARAMRGRTEIAVTVDASGNVSAD